MMRLGAKTFTTIFLLIVVALVVVSQKAYQLSYVTALEPATLFVIGIVSVFLSGGFCKYWFLHTKSRQFFGYSFKGEKLGHSVIFQYKKHILSIGQNHELKAFDFYPSIHRVIYLFVFLAIGLLCFNDRSIYLLKTLPKDFKTAKIDFCPTEAEIKAKSKNPIMQGCDFILRAYRLGYVKKLGNCEQKKKEEEERKLCTLRQFDEPYLHYTARQIVQFAKKLGKLLTQDQYQKERKKFDIKVANIEKITQYQKHALLASPRASHHIYTNLKPPRGFFKVWFDDIFSPSHCLDRFSKMPHFLKIAPKDPLGGSKALEHAFGHLLFNSRHEVSVGYCREYEIHWDAAENSCAQLAKNPTKFLRDRKHLKGVTTVIERFDLNRDLKELKNELNSLDVPKLSAAKMGGKKNQPPDPKDQGPDEIAAKSAEKGKKEPKVEGSKSPNAKEKPQEKEPKGPLAIENTVSFQCFMVTDQKPGKKDYEVAIGTHKFKAYETRLRKKHEGSDYLDVTHAAILKDMAALSVPGFSYLGYLSNDASVRGMDKGSQSKVFANHRYMLTKLEILRSLDVLLGHEWLRKREDLLEVYPWFLHLYHFVEIFRGEYRPIRGRL